MYTYVVSWLSGVTLDGNILKKVFTNIVYFEMKFFR